MSIYHLAFHSLPPQKKRTCIRAHRSPHAKTRLSLSSKHHGFPGYLCTAGPIDGHRAGRASHRSSIHKRGYGGASARQILSMPSVRALAAKRKARWWSEGNLSPRCVRLASHSGAHLQIAIVNADCEPSRDHCKGIFAYRTPRYIKDGKMLFNPLRGLRRGGEGTLLFDQPADRAASSLNSGEYR